MKTLITVAQAARMANVTPKTIYYHLNKSFKLPRHYRDGQVFLTEEALKTLYPKSRAGVKQHISDQRYNSVAETVDLKEMGLTVEDLKVVLSVFKDIIDKEASQI